MLKNNNEQVPTMWLKGGFCSILKVDTYFKFSLLKQRKRKFGYSRNDVMCATD
jgi:hypothetical protein